MKGLVVILLLGLTCVVGIKTSMAADEAGMRASTPAVKRELVAVIESQLAAFREGDVAKAYGYVSRPLRAQRPLRMFSAIVEANYPEIWANTRAEFGLARDDGERATLMVVVYANDDRASYDFMLVNERAGWRIEGVLRRAPPKGNQV